MCGDRSDSRVLVLGGGWVGSRMANRLASKGASVFVTHRDLGAVDSKKPYFRPEELAAAVPRLQFELETAASWRHLPDPSELTDVIATFPMTDADTAMRFHKEYLSRVRNVIACSSTSVYDVLVPNQFVTEETPLKRETPRGHVEEALRERGATLLALGGIFGDGSKTDDISARSVCSCLAMHTAHAPVSSARKLVNMVHIEDILIAMENLIADPREAERFNAVSCTYDLRSLIKHCGMEHVANVCDTVAPDLTSKYICNQKLASYLALHGHKLYEPATALPRHKLLASIAPVPASPAAAA